MACLSVYLGGGCRDMGEFFRYLGLYIFLFCCGIFCVLYP